MTLTPIDTGRVWGIDISHWDGHVNLSVTKSRGAAFVFIKGVDGALITKYFVENRQRAIDAGLLHAPYFWLYRDRDVSCTSQANACSELVSRYPSTLPPVVDLEWTTFGGIKTYPDYTDLEKWVNRWLLLNNRRPILYSSAGYMNALGRMPDELKKKFSGFWFANYGGSYPSLPYGFLTCQFWQFTATADAQYYAPGNLGKLELDANYWQGNLQGLYDFAGYTPTQEQTMKVIQGIALGNVTRRKSPAGEQFVPSRYLVTGDKIEADRQDATLPQWLHLTKINGVPVVGDEWVSAGTDQRYIKWSWVELPPPPPPPAGPTLTHTITVYSDGSVKVDGSPVP